MEHKRGDSFLYAVTIPLDKPDGYYIDHDVPRCQIRGINGSFRIECETRWLIPETTRVLIIGFEEGMSEAWPLGKHKIDLEFVRTADKFRRHTNTIFFDVVDVVTKELVEVAP